MILETIGQYGLIGFFLLTGALVATGDEAGLVSIVERLGPLVSLVLFFVWRDYLREQRMGERINQLEDYQRRQLADALESSTVGLAKAIDVLSETNERAKRSDGVSERATAIMDHTGRMLDQTDRTLSRLATAMQRCPAAVGQDRSDPC